MVGWSETLLTCLVHYYIYNYYYFSVCSAPKRRSAPIYKIKSKKKSRKKKKKIENLWKVNFAIVIFLRWIIQKPLLRRRNEIHCGIYSCRFPQQHLAGSTILKLENARVRSCDRATILYSSSHHRGISVFAAQLAITVALVAAVPHRRRRRQRQRRARRSSGGCGSRHTIHLQ